ncbi:MAG: hypothetical protein D4R67_06120 [Bacteroidetes bacterium]|nr:MAG: hypothetical protein D4R67_06120 [Bacteroidota bacterium]
MKALSISIVICLVGFCMTSCKPVLKWISGLKQPKIESIHSISTYLKKKKIDTYDTLYICRDSAALYALMSYLKDFPTTLLFDKNGLSVQQSDSSYCPGKAEEFMGNLTGLIPLTHNDRFSNHNILQWIYPVAGNTEEIQGHEFSLFVFWAKYCGSLNNGVFRVLKAAQENPDIHVKICVINIDFIDVWEMKTKPAFHFE